MLEECVLACLLLNDTVLLGDYVLDGFTVAGQDSTVVPNELGDRRKLVQLVKGHELETPDGTYRPKGDPVLVHLSAVYADEDLDQYCQNKV